MRDFAPDEAGGLQRSRPGWVVPAIVGSALLLVSLESTIITNALPTIARAMHEEPLRLNVALTVFLLASAVFLPLSGWVADRYGAKRIFLSAMALFAVSSAACGFAHSLSELVLGRFVQGTSAAMMTPVGRLLLLRTTPKHELVAAMAIYTTPTLLGPLIGPLLGGFIVTYFDWRWIFFINLPVAAIALLLAHLCLPSIPKQGVSPVDWRGVILTGAGLPALIFGFANFGRGLMPPWEAGGLFATGLGCFLLYWRHARGNPHALIDLSVFRIRTFNAAIVGGAFERIALGALPFLLTILLQVAFGMSALAAGGLTFASSIGGLLVRGFGPRTLQRFGFRRVLLINGALAALGYASYALFTRVTPPWQILAMLVIGGVFRSFQFVALSGLVFADIDETQISRASTTYAMGQQLMLTLGASFAAALLRAIEAVRGESRLSAEVAAPAFVVLGLVSVLSLLWYRRLPAGAGDAVAGRVG